METLWASDDGKWSIVRKRLASGKIIHMLTERGQPSHRPLYKDEQEGLPAGWLAPTPAIPAYVRQKCHQVMSGI